MFSLLKYGFFYNELNHVHINCYALLKEFFNKNLQNPQLFESISSLRKQI